MLIAPAVLAASRTGGRRVFSLRGRRRGSPPGIYRGHSSRPVRAAGYPRVRSYVGSWNEWGNLDVPVEHPTRR